MSAIGDPKGDLLFRGLTRFAIEESFKFFVPVVNNTFCAEFGRAIYTASNIITAL